MTFFAWVVTPTCRPEAGEGRFFHCFFTTYETKKKVGNYNWPVEIMELAQYPNKNQRGLLGHCRDSISKIQEMESLLPTTPHKLRE